MTEQFDFGGKIVWQPNEEYLDHARLMEFMRQFGVSDFQALMTRSTQDYAWFTEAVLKFLDIQFYHPYESIVDISKGIAWPVWCPGGKMNIIHNCLDKYIGTTKELQAAFIWEGEDGGKKTVSYLELYQSVNQTANLLRSLGLKKGDAIGVFMPMVPELITAVLAIAKIGGIILPLFSGYGSTAISTRLNDADAKALFVADGFYRRGKPVAMKSTADLAAENVPALKHMIVLNRVGLDPVMQPERDLWWHETVPLQPKQAVTEQTSAEDHLMVIYTSGTTGRPKGAVHTHCGFPVKSAQDMAFGTDIHPGEVIYWMTDMGWMMGPWLVFGSLLLGATFFIYDGAPDYPDPGRLWKMVEEHKITVLGIYSALSVTL